MSTVKLEPERMCCYFWRKWSRWGYTDL